MFYESIRYFSWWNDVVDVHDDDDDDEYEVENTK